jgi:exonuclease III
VRGIGADSKCSVIKELISNARCFVVCIQETKWNAGSMFRLRKICNGAYTNAIFKDSNGVSGGMLLGKIFSHLNLICPYITH